ncbi:hypothetical protein CRD60_00745 [Bifidobacterium aemilianum]|uniref:Primosomal protein N' 3' DNA-binding domain-containing protein n=1 Tax=Bifidobacterium aemilianum TaxID=2493120 RepID=A0A366KA09_9BIFI|nr:hypothetical protein CRD60_00745 [Bifidobacterium aemilianum]
MQATHLGQSFDYLIDHKLDEEAQAGVMVRVRFGGRRVNGIIWQRVESSQSPRSSLRYIERVLTPAPLVSQAMRADITAIADAYGGTRANIVRLAVPPRVARVDQERQLAMAGGWQSHQSIGSTAQREALDAGFERLLASYRGAVQLRSAVEGNSFASLVMDSLPGPGRWAQELALLALDALMAGKSAVLELPGGRQVYDLAQALESLGLRPFAPDKARHGGFCGDFAILTASMPPAERYRSYLAVASGQVRCVIGARAVMYAPVEGPALFAIVEDAAYQNADGMMPYANARGVMRLRAQLHQGVFLAMANARTPISQWEVEGLPDSAQLPVEDDWPPVDGGEQSEAALETVGPDDVQLTDTAAQAGAEPAAAAGDQAAAGKASSLAADGERSFDRADLDTAVGLSADGPEDQYVDTATAPAWIASVTPAPPPAQGLEQVEIGISGFSSAIEGLPAVLSVESPWIRWFNRQELTRLADPTVGARVPHMAVRILDEALEQGPVLLSIPQDGLSQSLTCQRCHHQARCPRCTGPLRTPANARMAPRCCWCGAAAVNWTCPHCGSDRMRVIRVGAAGTAGELQGLFRGVPMVLSSPSQPQGIVEVIDQKPRIVIATPGAEPRVAGKDGGQAPYRAVAILDAWTSLYAPGVDARVDALTAWMRAVSLCAPRAQGGTALILGETDPAIAKSLLAWDPTILAKQELRERMEVGLPPALCAACVWGRRDAVGELLRSLGFLDGDRSMVTLCGMSVPAVLGPVPIPQPRTVDARELEATQDRVKAVIRVEPGQRAQLARELKAQVARHVASRTPGELRFQLDPKDLI